MKFRGVILASALVLVPTVALWPAETATGADGKPALDAGDAEKATPDEMERYGKALALLERSTEVPDMVRAMGILRDGFPGSRPLLQRCVEGGSVRAQGFALQVLGERGDPDKDLEVVEKALGDADKRIRLAAIMALRRFSQEDGAGLPALRKHLPVEVEPNNRKMLVKGFQYAADEEAVPLLIRVLSREKDQGVKRFIIVALEAITEKKYGSDIQAWQNWLELYLMKKQAEELIDTEMNGKKETE